MANYANLPAPTPEGGLNRYMQEIRKFPLLEPEEEYMLAKAWVEKEDTGAAHKMVTSHLRLAAKIAMQLQEWREDESADQAGDYEARDELEVRREMLAEALDVLNDREKDILTQRRLSDQPVTLEDLSTEYGVSRERIRQIEVRAFEKLQKKMREIAKAKGLLATA